MRICSIMVRRFFIFIDLFLFTLTIKRDRRMSPNHLWHMNPQSHPVTYCSFDKRTLIFALTPSWRKPDDVS